ncbi:MAG TPA: YhcH/YjgK/YiaL family protein [Pontiella sp.]
MILDALKNAAKYTTLRNGFDEGFGFLNQPGLAELKEGKYEISGDRIYAIIALENGRAVDEAELEGHRKYIDIQYVISGEESMGWAPREGLPNSVEYDEEKDLEFFQGRPQSIIKVPEGSFIIFFPSDAHLPLIGSGPIHKVILKVAVD